MSGGHWADVRGVGGILYDIAEESVRFYGDVVGFCDVLMRLGAS